MKGIVAVCALLAMFPAAVSATQIVDGKMVFPAKNGKVLFDHDMHVYKVRNDCRACHKVPGGIENFGKAYAHEACIGCHKPQDEEPVGPITCEGCHTR